MDESYGHDLAMLLGEHPRHSGEHETETWLHVDEGNPYTCLHGGSERGLWVVTPDTPFPARAPR
jgi:hypothetical protein